MADYPSLQRDITEKGIPFLEKHKIPYDAKNYQYDGLLKAGDYNFWFDGDDYKRDFRTDAPDYKGRGFADLEELLAYALDVADAKEEYRKAWGDDVYKERSKKNYPKGTDDPPKKYKTKEGRVYSILDSEDPEGYTIEWADGKKDRYGGGQREWIDREKHDNDLKNGLVTELIDTNNNGKIEKSEMENFTDSLNDYMNKNKKGRDDIPVTTRR